LDHVFCFCESSGSREVEALRQAGFTLTSGRRHAGQGTANRSLYFHESYLELIFLESLIDARKNPLRLDRRANWRQNGLSPFGLGLRGQLSEKDRARFWEYRPPYMPEGVILIHESNEKRPEQPLIFVLPSAKRPIDNGKADQEPFDHRTRSKAIQGVVFSGPGYAWPDLASVPDVQFAQAMHHHLRVEVDGAPSSTLELNDALTLVCR
jgi:hypothetical protein